MKRATFGAASALLAACLSGFSGGANAGLVTNGGFETGDLTGWTQVGNPAFTFVDSGFSHSGNFALFMGEVGGLGSISQALSTVAGTQYNLTFWFAGDGDSPSQFQALINSTVLFNVVDPAFDIDYVKYSFNFTATSSSTLLTFKYRDDPFFINLDDVDVVQVASVPEPSSASLVVLSGLMLALAPVARRRVVVPTKK